MADFAALCMLEENIDNLTAKIHGALVDIRSTWQSQEEEKKKHWMTNDILDLCYRRRSLKKRKEGSLAMQNYSQSQSRNQKKNERGKRKLGH